MKLVFTGSFLLLCFPAAISGCSCARFSLCERLAQPSTKPFIGEVVAGGIDSLRIDPWYSPVQLVRFKVLESFGVNVPRPDFLMRVEPTSGMCSPMPYIRGRRYLVFPETVHAGTERTCGFTGLLVDDYHDEVAYVREYYGGRQPYRLAGYVAVSEHEELVRFRAKMQFSRLPEGVRITATRGGQTASALVNARGWYSLNLPGPGTYLVRVQSDSFHASRPTSLNISAGGCVIQDFALTTGNTIEGQLRDPKGRPLRAGSIALLDADPPPAGGRPFGRGTDVNEYGNFIFKNVTPGRYLVRYGTEPPAARSLSWNTAYFPFSSSRAAARVIEIRGNATQVKGLVIVPRPQVAYRALAVRVRFPDGRPMTTADIHVTGDDWEGRVVIVSPEKDPWGRIRVPADRKLRIAVTDSWRRDLKREYAAEFSPGSHAIEKEFVIQP